MNWFGWLKNGILALALLGLSGQRSWAGEGTTGADFLRLIPGARSAGLAGCYTANGNDAESVFFNPAGMVGLLNPQIGMSHLVWWEDITYESIWAVQPLGDDHYLGMMFGYLRVPAFNSTENEAQPPEQASGFAGGLSYAWKIHRAVSLGVQLKGYESNLSDLHSLGGALDLGAQVFAVNDQLILAGSLKNLGYSTAYLDSRDTLPMAGEVGAAYQLWPDEAFHVTLASDLTLPLAGKMISASSLEGWFYHSVALRCGVKFPSDAGDWLAVGLGIRWSRIHVDYALSPFGALGMAHRVSLGYDFGSQRRLARPKLEIMMITKQISDTNGRIGQVVHLIPNATVPAGLQRWEVSIFDHEQKPIKQYSGQGPLPIEVVWDGTTTQGTRADMEGYYTYSMRIVDQQGYQATASGEILPISITKLPRLKALPRDIYAGQVNFTPKFASELKEWEINIVSPDGKIVKKYYGVGAVPKDFSWDGRDERNQPVAVHQGFYFAIRVKDKENNEVDSKAPLAVIDAGTKARSSNDLALDEDVAFHVQSPKDIKIKSWTLDIVEQSTGEVIRSYEGNGQLPEEVVWDSKDEHKKLVSNKKAYGLVLRLQDPIGNVWQHALPIRATPVKINADEPGILVIKIEGILFDFNRAELKPEMSEKIIETAKLVKAYSKKNIQVLIEGHTDETGTDEYNLTLSKTRAQMVMRFLVEEKGVPSSLITMQGYGKQKPVSRDQNQNRRVEITLRILNNAK